jgi:RHS repeat-associated protein
VWEEDSSGVRKTYIQFGGKVVAVKERNSGGTVTTTYLHGDHLGSMSLATSSAGTVSSQQEFDAWGKVRQGSLPQTELNYTGQRLDSTGLLFYNARYYDPQLGKFISSDTIVPSAANPQTFNRYGYAYNNPLKYTDPTGHCGFLAALGPWGWAAAGACFIGTAALAGATVFAAAEGGQAAGQLVNSISPSEEQLSNQTNAYTYGELSTVAIEQHTEEENTEKAKRGPKTDPDAPHNKKIKERIEELKEELGEDWEHTHGGDKTEEVVKTEGGVKSKRRPDMTFTNTETGEVYRENVGKTYANGDPVRREREALDDLERVGPRPRFTRYDDR